MNGAAGCSRGSSWTTRCSRGPPYLRHPPCKCPCCGAADTSKAEPSLSLSLWLTPWLLYSGLSKAKPRLVWFKCAVLIKRESMTNASLAAGGGWTQADSISQMTVALTIVIVYVFVVCFCCACPPTLRRRRLPVIPLPPLPPLPTLPTLPQLSTVQDGVVARLTALLLIGCAFGPATAKALGLLKHHPPDPADTAV